MFSETLNSITNTVAKLVIQLSEKKRQVSFNYKPHYSTQLKTNNLSFYLHLFVLAPIVYIILHKYANVSIAAIKDPE